MYVNSLGYDHKKKDKNRKKKNHNLLLLLFLFNFQLLKEAKETFFYIYECIYFTSKNPDVQNDKKKNFNHMKLIF